MGRPLRVGPEEDSKCWFTHNEQARRVSLPAACRFEPSLRAASACGLLTAAVRRLIATEDFNGDELAVTVDRAARHDEITGFEIR